MKKDMGGAASVLAAAHMMMDAKLKVRLRVLIPAVENAISGDAFRPLDIYASRKGITVEIGNTDAEGRLVLADALALADEEKPELIVDMATLTGAARVALGPEMPPLLHATTTRWPPSWRAMPTPSTIRCGACRCGGPTSRCSIPRSPTSTMSPVRQAGSITAALFLARFVTATKRGRISTSMPGHRAPSPARPEGGECQAARALYALLRERYGT